MGRSELKPINQESSSMSGAPSATAPLPEPQAPYQACDECDWPLSFGQERLWFLDQLQPDTALYNMPSVFRARGPFDAAAFEAALNGLAARHETSRTRFVAENGLPRQVIEDNVKIPARLVDHSHLPE